MLNRIITLDEVDSTNNYLKLNRGELPDGTLVTARIQTAGKGRRGHEWLADQGMLPLSLLLKQPPHPDTLTLCAGVAVCEALEPLLIGEELGDQMAQRHHTARPQAMWYFMRERMLWFLNGHSMRYRRESRSDCGIL